MTKSFGPSKSQSTIKHQEENKVTGPGPGEYHVD